ncbi:lethal(3)malignant brain tumor-like protein 3 isoform X2 [Thrips palmi]|nr:lethal(3)malignant brain tumor-like protein 3 isoform X2 [Thrips palmi]XP_034251581.1 lethal(3)malignant brain tumor-like protein 3 isoform X2 [Thrips palmi]XP_034251583.1 lethal(3)malignant brain tumor-like protein 3 isoform X2 [Thrips palmi]XP_034251584.1 lethal(3)malignant brain tumor-like protein 3 isoform X2 [Thrips palmi]XP_034251585.1 lethal(3)malignant brain tumor-like protein 3 isoform X2 [Thrips palmi]XP_034251586.1 lethal(3)malignant brain tumor-like protein 3 isoform X2 [Thrips 
MNASPHHLSQNEANSVPREIIGTFQSPNGQIVRPVLSRGPVAVSSPVTSSTAANGRVLPVVYLKMQQREQVVPVVSRSGNLISTIGPKISTAPSGNITTSLSGNQSSFVIQGPIRAVSQPSGNQPTQPHIITLPKVPNTSLALSNQQLIALQSLGPANQGGPVQQQQYVTIQAPIVSKTQQNTGALNTSQGQPQYVTIRTPVLNPSAGATSSAAQSQYVTIQAPVMQGSGQNTQTQTFIPVSSVGQSPVGSVKSPITYQVVKSSGKTGEQLVYPVSVANIMPSQPKMVFTPVTMMPKVSVVSAGSTSSSEIISNSSNISGLKLSTSSGQFSTKLLNTSAVNLLQGKSLQTLSLRKEGIILNNAEVSPSQSKVLSLPMGMSVSNTSSTVSPTQGFINLTIANGHIQQSNKPFTAAKVLQESPRTFGDKKQTELNSENSWNADTSESSLVIKNQGGKDSVSQKNPISENEVIDIKSILLSGGSFKTNEAGALQPNTAEATNVASTETEGTGPSDNKQDGGEEAQTPSSPINLFCEGEELAHSPPNEPPQPKYTITMSDNPDDDIKIQLVDTEGPNKSKEPTTPQPDDRPSVNPLTGKPFLKKSSPKLLSKASSTLKGQSLLRNPAATQSTVSPKASKPTNKVGVKSILKPQSGKKTEIKQEPSEGDDNSQTDVKDCPDGSNSPLTSSSYEDFDAMAALEWKNGVGLLPGSSLKFRMNEFGIMEMVSDDDAVKKGTDKDTNSDSEGLMIDEGSNSSVEAKPCVENTEKKKESKSDDVYCCETCNVYGLASEFLNERFCTQACSAAFTVKKAWQYRREQDLRALRLRRKKRRLEQQRLAREKAEQESQENEDVKSAPQLVSKLAKKFKSVTAESMSDGEDSVDDPSYLESPMPLSSSPSFNASDKIGSSDVAHDENGKKLSKNKQAANFTWFKYLDMVKAKAAPSKLFKDPFPFGKNGFKVGMKLEGIDPDHPSLFCVLTVAEVKGHRLRLHFDGYAENYDFWVNSDSPEIFQPGWCEKNMRKLTPPRGYNNFNWNSYLKVCKATAAPRLLFHNKGSANVVCPNGFRIGMKLEAVDRKNSSLVCVASIADLVDGRCLIHFDSWDEMYDYWADPSSPYIHPIGWCDEHGVTLTPPNQYKDPSSFYWDRYLKETKTSPAPPRAFKQRQPSGFRRGMRLEAVDKRVPHLIRVATVDDVQDHQIRIRFDGWPDEYSYWVDDDSPDIHPAGWCLETKHPLEPPPSEEDMKVLARCGVPGCKGEGHVKGSKYTSHITAQNCPYSQENLLKDGHLPDRLTSGNDSVSLEESPTSSHSDKIDQKPPPKWKRLLQDADELDIKRARLSDDDDDVFRKKPSLIASMQQKLQSELERSVIDPGYQIETGPGRPALWAKHSYPLHSSPMVRDAVNPQAWTIEDVLEFLSSVPCLEEYGKTFKEQDIDGEALLMLTQNELVSNMKLKLGHAIRLYNCIVILRQKCF